MKLGQNALSLLLFCAASTCSDAFVGLPNSRLLVSRSSSSLNARYVPPLPPPPPPPPAVTVTTVDTANDFLEQAVRDLQNAIDSFTIPQISSALKEQASSLHIQNALDNLQIPDVSAFKEQVISLQNQLLALDADLIQQILRLSTDLQSQSSLLADHPELQPAVQSILTTLQPLLQSPTLTLGGSAVLSYIVVSSILTTAGGGQAPVSSQPYPLNKYDPYAARAYFDKRPLQVAARGLTIALQSLKFGLSLLLDKLQNKIAVNEMQRGRELAQLLTRLGPTFIKVGQSLSIRTDLLSAAYIRGLEMLQDQVPSFSTDKAKIILEAEWGKPISQILMDDLSAEPIAAASLGQVYKARLQSTGEEVAIKVQRPDITEQIALDMHLLREFGAVLKRFANLNTDTVGTVDVWGAGFVDELDYIQEAINGEEFSEQIKGTSLKDVVFAPAVVKDYSTRSVLVTSWVDGERLDRSSSEDVTVLCSIAMNTYLTMLLELGVLHCDPHPGNLLRTPEGKLCILDFGMVTRLNKDLQLTLIEHMAHLTSADYAEIPRDLLLLGFISEDKADLIEDSGVVELLAEIYGAWTSGGGVAAINVNKVISQLQDLTAEKGNLFRIPPYFAYIAKSFSVLEGIGLSNDSKYSIINECLPYVSNRLLTDQEKMGPALSTFIFGPDKANADRIVDYKRVEQLVEGFGEYTTSSSGALLGKENLSRSELMEDATDQILDLVFTDEETPLQEIFLEQMAKIISASGRTIWTQLRERSGTLPSGRTRLGTLIDPLGLWRTSPLVRTNELDERTVETTRKLVALMQKQIEKSGNPLFDLSTLSREETLSLSSILVRKVWARRTGVLQTSNRFARTLLQLTADKLELGERDSRRLPPRVEALSEKTDKLPDVSSRAPEGQRLEGARKLLSEVQEKKAAEHATAVTQGKNESPRLEGARKLLLQADDADEVAVLPEVVL